MPPSFIHAPPLPLRPPPSASSSLPSGSPVPTSTPTRLVLALVAEAKIDVVPGSAEYALPFTTLEDALDSQAKFVDSKCSFDACSSWLLQSLVTFTAFKLQM